MKKDLGIIILILAVLTLSIYNALTDQSESTDHHEFFNDMRQFKHFMSKGKRNTADMGLELCHRLNNLEAREGIELTDCDEIYKQQHPD